MGFSFVLIGYASVAEEIEPSEFDGITEKDRLSGSWWGARSFLERKGLSLELVYTLDAFLNASGGVRQSTAFLGNLDLIATFETEPLLGFSGGKLYLYGLGNHGKNPSTNVGDLQGVSNIEAFDTWKLYEAWYQQSFFEDKVSALIGLYDLNSELEVIPSAAVLINSSFGIGADFALSGLNGPSIFPTTSIGARLEIQPTESFYTRLVVLDGVPGDPDEPRGTQVNFQSQDGFLIACEIGFINNSDQEVSFTHSSSHQDEPRQTENENSRSQKFGKYAIGAWGYTSEFNQLKRLRSDGALKKSHGTYGLYALAEKCIYNEEGQPSQGLTVFARIGVTDSRVNLIEAYLGGGFVYRGLFPHRPSDQLALGVAAAHLSSELREADRRIGMARDPWETAIELTYRFMVSPAFSLQPDLQYVINPSGDPQVRDAVVFGLRMNLSF